LGYRLILRPLDFTRGGEPVEPQAQDGERSRTVNRATTVWDMLLIEQKKEMKLQFVNESSFLKL